MVKTLQKLKRSTEGQTIDAKLPVLRQSLTNLQYRLRRDIFGCKWFGASVNHLGEISNAYDMIIEDVYSVQQTILVEGMYEVEGRYE